VRKPMMERTEAFQTTHISYQDVSHRGSEVRPGNASPKELGPFCLPPPASRSLTHFHMLQNRLRDSVAFQRSVRPVRNRLVPEGKTAATSEPSRNKGLR